MARDKLNFARSVFLSPDSKLHQKKVMSLSSRVLHYFVLSILFSFGPGLSSIEAVVEPAYGGQIMLPLSVTELELDPLKMVNWEHLWIGSHIYETLFQYQQGTPVATLAADWSASENKKEWQFFLRKNLLFANQQPVTALDVKLSFERALLYLEQHRIRTPLQDLSGAADFLTKKKPTVDGLIVTDDKTLSLVFDQAQQNLISELTQLKYAILPQGRYQLNSQIGTGPFFIKSYTPGRSIQVLDHNEHYYRGRAYLDKVIVALGVTPDEAQPAFEADEYDFIFQVPGRRMVFPYQEQAGYFRQKRLHPVGTLYLDLNPDHELLKHDAFRSALKVALDLESIQKILLKGEGIIARSFIAPHLSPHHTLYEPLEYNPTKARNLVQTNQPLDVKNRSFVLLVPRGYRLLKYIAGRIQVNLLDAGLKMNIEERTISEIERRISEADYDSALRLSFPESPDPYLILKVQLERFLTSPLESRNALLQPLQQQLALCEALEDSDPQRITNLFRVEDELLQWNIIIPLFHPAVTWLEKKNLFGLQFTPTGLLELENAWLKPVSVRTVETP